MMAIVGEMIDYMLDECKDRACSVSVGSTYSRVQYFVSKNGLKIREWNDKKVSM
jgi:hypothetical protein